jgi:processive 1,2-diacylglycerol beta-glucosyltransferase
MPTEGPILVLTASAGAGHVIAARALEATLRQRLPGADIEYLDVLDKSNRFFRRLYAGGYLALVNHTPPLMGVLYDWADRPSPLSDRWRGRFQDLNMGSAIAHVVKRRPRLVLNTHFLPAEMVARLRRSGQLACPQVTITTDFETHRMWIQPPTQRYYTATDDGKAYLESFGVPGARILATGIPVRPGFEQPLDRAAIRAQYGLPADLPVVLLLCGGFGVGPTEERLRQLMQMPAAAQVVVITGRNEKLRLRLERMVMGAARPVQVIGFTDQMHEWMAAADLLVTKPGGLTVSEALVSGVPLVMVDPIPGQESRNSDYLLEHGAAIKVTSTRMLGRRVALLLQDQARLQAMRAAALRIARPGAAGRIVEDALALLAR